MQNRKLDKRSASNTTIVIYMQLLDA